MNFVSASNYSGRQPAPQFYRAADIFSVNGRGRQRIMIADSETAILHRLIETDRQALSVDAARYILSLDFPQEDQERMNQLAASAQSGELSAEDSVELQGYLHVSHLLALLQSKARRALKQAEQAA